MSITIEAAAESASSPQASLSSCASSADGQCGSKDVLSNGHRSTFTNGALGIGGTVSNGGVAGGKWRGMSTTTTTSSDAMANSAGGRNSVLAMLQRAFCAQFGTSSASFSANQYRTVLTRESTDSGLELDELDMDARRRRKRAKRRECGREKEEGERSQERMLKKKEEGEEKEEEENHHPEVEEEQEAEGRRSGRSSHKTTDGRMSADAEEASETDEKKRRSLGRLLSTLFFPSSSSSTCPSPSPARHSMFDFPVPDHPGVGGILPGGMFASPIAQLSHSNAVLVHENERLAERVRELELMLRDHVAHLNSIYHTLHRMHGFQALQLPDGELVHLSQFQGFPLEFVRAAPTGGGHAEAENGHDAGGNTLDEAREQQVAAAPTTKQLIGQARRFLLHQRQQQQAASTGGSAAESQSLSSGSASSFASGSGSVASDSVLIDAADLSQAMMRRLCIRPVAGDDRDEMQAFMDWLKSGGGADDDASSTDADAVKKRLARAAALREAGRAWVVQQSLSVDAEAVDASPAERQASAWRATRSETQAESRATESGAGINGNGTVVAVPHHPRAHRNPPVYSVMSKSQRIRSQYPSMTSRTRSPLHSSASASAHASGTASSLSTSSGFGGGHHHHGGIGGSGHQSGDDGSRSPRRGGIGITSMGRMGARASDAHKTQKRNLI